MNLMENPNYLGRIAGRACRPGKSPAGSAGERTKKGTRS